MADTSQNLDVSTVLKHLQAIFEQEGLADLKITFPYTPAPGSWQAAIQDGGLTGFSDWLLRDSATALMKQGAQKSSQDASGKKDPVAATSPSDQAPVGAPKDAASSPSSTLAFDLTEAARHVGQVFRSMLLGQSPQQAAQPAAKAESHLIVPAVANETLTAFNDMLHKLIPGKDGQGPALPSASSKPSAAQPADSGKSSPPPPTSSKDNPADWKYWADKGLSSLNQFLNQGIKSISGKDAQPSTQERPTKSSGPAADSTPAKTNQADKKSADSSEDADGDDKNPKAKSDADKDDADDESDTDSSGSTSDDSSSESDAGDSGSDEDESSSSDDDSSDAYDGERDHLLDVGEG